MSAGADQASDVGLDERLKQGDRMKQGDQLRQGLGEGSKEIPLVVCGQKPGQIDVGPGVSVKFGPDAPSSTSTISLDPPPGTTPPKPMT